MVFRPSRSASGGDDRFLHWKVRLFVIGAGVGTVGMVAELSWLVWIAVAVLAAGVGLRLLEGRGSDPEETTEG